MKRLTIVLGASIFAGCISTVTVTNTSQKPSAEGIRYSLPETMLAMKPDPAGKTDYTVELISVPNSGKEYAIHASTFLGKYDLDVMLKDGLLEKVQFASNDTAVASQLFDTAAGLAAKEVELEAAAEKDARTKKQTLDQAVVAAELALEQARLDTEALEQIWKEATGAAKVAARAAFLKGQAEVSKQQVALSSARAALADFESTNAGLLARVVAPEDNNKTGGPMMFQIVDTADPARCKSASDCPGDIKIKALAWRESSSSQPKQLGLDIFAKPKDSTTKQPPKQLSGALVYATNDASFWHVHVNFAGDLPPNGQMTKLIWQPYRDAESPSPLAAGCSNQLNELPQGAAENVIEDLGPKVSVDAVGAQARFTFPRACFPPGFYKLGAVFPMSAGDPAVVDTTAHLCEKQDCARARL